MEHYKMKIIYYLLTNSTEFIWLLVDVQLRKVQE